MVRLDHASNTANHKTPPGNPRGLIACPLRQPAAACANGQPPVPQKWTARHWNASAPMTTI